MIRRLSPAAARAALAVLLLHAAACPATTAPHPLPFDPPPAARLAAEPPAFPPPGLTDEGTETLARWTAPYDPRVAAELRVDAAVRAPVVVLPGACAERRAEDCACTDDVLLVASAAGTLSALSVDGERRWEWRCGSPLSQSPVAAPGEAIFVRCDDGTVAALDPSDGAERWRILRAAAEGALATPLLWSPWAGLLFAGDAGTSAVHRTGAVVWSQPEPGPFLGRPALSGRVVVFAGLDRRVRGLDAATGDELWRQWVVGGVEGGVLELRDGAVVVATLYGKVYEFGMPEGTQRWEAAVGELVRGGPAEGTDGTILVPVMDGALAGLDPASGALLWGHTVPAPVLAGPLPVERGDGAPGRAYVVYSDRTGFLAELSYRARPTDGATPDAAETDGPAETWRLNAGLPLESRPTLEGASLLVGLEDGRVLRVLPGTPACAAGEESVP